MLSITELVERIPSATMDSQKQMISIPIQEYENCRNIMALQDKQSIIRDLQKLLLNKEEDLQRYKEKCELQESVLQRTQKALDKCIQSDQAHSSIPLKTTVNRQHRAAIPLRKSEPKQRSSSNTGAIEVVSRAVGDESSRASGKPVTSLPDQMSRLSLTDDSSNIKSLPPCLSVGSPGMSTALLKRLVQENVKLKNQLDKRQQPKSAKNVEELEKIISDLKQKLFKKQQIIDDLLNQGGSQGQAASRLEALHKENSAYQDTLEMDKIVINALKQENAQCRKERDETESLLVQYRQYKSRAEDSSDRLTEMERSLREESESRKAVESKVESLQAEVDKLTQALEKAETDKELAQKNFNTLAGQYHKSPERHSTPQPAFMSQAPHLLSPQLSASTQPASLPQGYGLSQSMYSDSQRIPPHTQVYGRSPSPQLPVSRIIPESPSLYGAPKTFTQPLQESSTARMSQSMYNAPTQSQTPLPTERKTYKCPRCDTKFMVLQGYRDHIKVCLKG